MSFEREIRFLGAAFFCTCLVTIATPDAVVAQEFACCLPNDECIDTDEATCLDQDGEFVGGEGSRTCDEIGGCVPPTTGACCGEFEGGCADDFTEQACIDNGGTFEGLGTECSDPGACEPPQPDEFACCLSGGGCVDADEANCIAQGGDFVGGPTSRTCAELGDCPTTGACCNNAGAGPCLDGLTEDECDSLGGVFEGLGTVCGDTAECDGPPPNPILACCIQQIFCFDTNETSCINQGGVFVGGPINATCAEIGSCPSANNGACCNGGVCTDVSGDACIAGGGFFAGSGTSCTGGIVCEVGACCNDGLCTEVSGARCDLEGGIFAGVATTCRAIRIFVPVSGYMAYWKCKNMPVTH